MVLEAIWVEHPDTTFVWNLMKQWKRLPQKPFNIDMHSELAELIWFRLGMMINTIELYILMLV